MQITAPKYPNPTIIMPTEKSKTIPHKYQQFDPSGPEIKYIFNYNSVETKDLHARLNGNPDLNICDLRRVSLWKLDRVLKVSEVTLSLLRAVAIKNDLKITDSIAKDAIEGLVASEGVGYPMASSILKFIRPDIFPIIDIRAYRALTGKKLYYKSYTLKKYLDYAERLQKIANDKCRPLCEIDEQLYCFDEKNNGPI